MFYKKFDQFMCRFIQKQIFFVRSMIKLIQFLWYYIYWAYTIADLFPYFRTFSNICMKLAKVCFQLLMKIWDSVYISCKTNKCRPEDLRGGAFSIHLGHTLSLISAASCAHRAWKKFELQLLCIFTSECMQFSLKQTSLKKHWYISITYA